MDNDSESLPKNTSLIKEWTLLLKSIEIPQLDLNFEEDTSIENLKLKINKIDFNQELKKLSEHKSELYKKIENIKNAIDEAHNLIENLELVGSDTDSIYTKINQYLSEGQKMTYELTDIDLKIKKIRQLQESF